MKSKFEEEEQVVVARIVKDCLLKSLNFDDKLLESYDKFKE